MFFIFFWGGNGNACFRWGVKYSERDKFVINKSRTNLGLQQESMEMHLATTSGSKKQEMDL